MTPSTDIRRPIVLVLCPMQIEREAIEACAKRRGVKSVRVVQTGIGKEATLRALEREVEASRDPLELGVILAGACGGLAESDDVPTIERVIDEHGHEWTPRLGVGTGVGVGAATERVETPERGVTLVAVDRLVTSPADKRRLREATGAAVVDMEAHAFATRCEHLRVAWGVVRGVSDTPEQTLPGEVLRWMTPEGGTRAGRAIVDMIVKPWLVPHVIGVMRRARRVMPLVGERVCDMAAEFVRWRSEARGVSVGCGEVRGAVARVEVATIAAQACATTKAGQA